MAGHVQLKFVMTECSKTQIRLTRPICLLNETTVVLTACMQVINLNARLVAEVDAKVVTDRYINKECWTPKSRAV